jgi:hypothetical protein
MLQKIIKINQLLILINLDLIRIKFMMIEEIGILLNQFLAFIQLADQDDNNFIEQIVRRRRRDILSRLLECHRVVLMRVEENRSVYYSAYVGTWFETYPERHFKRDFRFTKPTFWVRKQIVSKPEFSY